MMVDRLVNQLPAWNFSDDEMWQRDKFWCSLLRYMKVSEGPPKECAFILEHLLEERKDEDPV